MRGRRHHGAEIHVAVGDVEEHRTARLQLSEIETDRLGGHQMDRDRIRGKGIDHDQVERTRRRVGQRQRASPRTNVACGAQALKKPKRFVTVAMRTTYGSISWKVQASPGRIWQASEPVPTPIAAGRSPGPRRGLHRERQERLDQEGIGDQREETADVRGGIEEIRVARMGVAGAGEPGLQQRPVAATAKNGRPTEAVNSATSQRTSPSCGGRSKPAAMPIGRPTSRTSAISAIWIRAARRTVQRLTRRCA